MNGYSHEGDVEQEAKDAAYHIATTHSFTKRMHYKQFDAWEAKVDKEIEEYLRRNAGDKYDPDGSIYRMVIPLS